MKNLMSFLVVLVASTLIFANVTMAHNGNGGKNRMAGGKTNSRNSHSIVAGKSMSTGAVKGTFKTKVNSASRSAVKGAFKKTKMNSASRSAVKGTFKKTRVASNSKGAVKGTFKHSTKPGSSAKPNTVQCNSQK
jgi:hypothetical protein